MYREKHFCSDKKTNVTYISIVNYTLMEFEIVLLSFSL